MENIDKTINSDRTQGETPSAASAGRFRAGDVILGRYTVISELGQGGMGVVYRCLDQVGGVEVAVKGLPPEVSHNSDEMESIRDNYQIVRNLRHSNIVAITNLEKDGNGDYYMVMDVAEGENLNRWMRKHPNATNDQKVAILRQIASALDYAHSMRIVHRDIKPENIMMDAAGNARVLDFGLAAEVHSSQNRVSSTITSKSGTPHYKAPEQWLGQPQGRSSDLYSMAVMAFKLFFNRLPFDADDPIVLARAVLEAPTPVIDDAPGYVNAAFAKGLAKKPGDRFATCVEFVDALEGKVKAPSKSPSGKTVYIVKAKPVVVGNKPVVAAEHAGAAKPAASSKTAVVFGTIVFALIGAVLCFAMVRGQKKEAPDTNAVEQLSQQLSRMEEAKKREDAERLKREQERRDLERVAAERQRQREEKAAAEQEKLKREREEAAAERDRQREEKAAAELEKLKREREEAVAEREKLKREREEAEREREREREAAAEREREREAAAEREREREREAAAEREREREQEEADRKRREREREEAERKQREREQEEADRRRREREREEEARKKAERQPVPVVVPQPVAPVAAGTCPGCRNNPGWVVCSSCGGGVTRRLRCAACGTRGWVKCAQCGGTGKASSTTPAVTIPVVPVNNVVPPTRPSQYRYPTRPRVWGTPPQPRNVPRQRPVGSRFIR